jgi:hypothetical protein
MKRTTSSAVSALALTLALALAGCSAGGDETTEPTTPVSEEPTSPAPETTPEDAATAAETTEAAGTEASAPGSTVAKGELLNVPYTKSEGKTPVGVIATTVTTIEEAPAADLAELLKTNPELKGQKMYYIQAEMTKVSGTESLEFGGMTPDFDAIDKDKNTLQTVHLEGWENCPGTNFTTEFDAGEKLTTCVATLVPENDPAPAGAAWHDTDNDDYVTSEGTGLYWLD